MYNITPAGGHIVNYLENYYTNNDEEVRFDKKYNLIEFLTTMHYIKKYLPQNAAVLEIGAGTGRYSRTIADMGFQVEAVELVPHNIEIFRSLTTPIQNINITQGNALNLSMFPGNTFDVTLCLGPMYHLYTEADKRKAISEALRVTKPGGVVFVAYVISDGAILENLNSTWFLDYVDNGKINPVTFATTSTPEDIFELVRKEDIDRLMAQFNVERLHYVATDMVSRLIREDIALMTDETFDMYMRYHFAVCERPDMVGMTNHSLDIFKKL